MPNERRCFVCPVLAVLLIASVSGCPSPKGKDVAPGPNAVGGGTGKEAGHTHERGKMLIADVGPYHALLTAHLSSKDGNELDIFFETQDDENPKPVALALESFVVEAETAAGEKKELKFEPAPKEERPKDEKPGACSHFVAKAPWLKPEDKLQLAGKIQVDNKPLTMRWKDFNPKKFAHHED